MKTETVKENGTFVRAYAKGRRCGTYYFTLYALRRYGAAAKTDGARLGLTVSKKVGGAVVRNRVKRIMRAGYEAAVRKTPLAGGWDLIAAANTRAAVEKSPAMEKCFAFAFEKLGLTAAAKSRTGTPPVGTPSVGTPSVEQSADAPSTVSSEPSGNGAQSET